MKKNVLLGLTLMIVCFIAGGVYIAASIQSVTNKLEKVVSFHQVEFLRETLEHKIKAVQTDLLLQGSPHASSFDNTVALIESMENAADVCRNCHHSEIISRRLVEFEKAVELYMKFLSRTLTLRANSERLENARTAAFSHGEVLLQDVRLLSTASADKISGRIASIQGDINATNNFLIACLILGPIAIIIITGLFLNRFTGAIGTLVHAAEVLKRGDLDYRITAPLEGEFHTLASAFNSMAASIKEEQQKFASAYKSYQTLFETAGDAIMITGIEDELLGKIISANQAASELYGYSVEELLAMNVVKLVPDGKEDKFLAKMRTVLSGEWSHQRVRRRKKDGTLINVDLSMGPLQLGEQKYLLSFCRDITDQLHAEEELQRANQMALVGQMSAGLAHEIKNPLAGIKTTLDVLADDLVLQPDDKVLFARISNEIIRMEKLLKSLLNYGRPPQPQFDLVDMNRLLDVTLSNVETATRRNSEFTIRFTKELDPDLPRVEADSAQMQQVFLNILLNAVDAMENEGSIIILTRRKDENRILIKIADTGKGIPEATLKKIFNPFFTTKSKGTGLGLSICKRLVEQHGGDIQVESQVESGTSIIITLPLAQQYQE
ncbi:MAG: ATP-binding protein [Desulfuromonadales bacterium]|nr:ATP-binding protein [Desulfuromonadales bacterium]